MVAFLTNQSFCDVSDRACDALHEQGVPLIVGEIERVEGQDGILGQILLKDGRALALDYLFNLQGKTPNSELALPLGVEVSPGGYIETTLDQQTNVPGVLAAGDVTRMLAHQIATAVHEGISAASAANYFLYEPWQRHESYEEA